MRTAFWVSLIVAAISLVVGIIWRVTLIAWPRGLEAQAFLQFTQTALLFAIVAVLWMVLGRMEKA